MALFPCDHHGGPYRGRSNAAYPAIIRQSTATRRKLRLCRECLELLVVDSPVSMQLLAFESLQDQSIAASHDCLECGDPPEGGALFVTVYFDGADRQDYYAPLCGEHAALAFSWWHLDVQAA